MDELTGYFGRRGSKSLAHRIAEDEAVAKRGKPSLPKLKFMEGLGPEDPRFEPEFDWRHAVRCANVEVTEL